jgi:hypothetical protein
MPRSNKRKKQLAAVEDGTGKRRKTSKPREERLKVPNEDDSSPIEAIVGPDTISSLHAEAATNTALPDVATSLPPADLDVVDDANANANTDCVTNIQSNNHPRAADPSTSKSSLNLSSRLRLQLHLRLHLAIRLQTKLKLPYRRNLCL